MAFTKTHPYNGENYQINTVAAATPMEEKQFGNEYETTTTPTRAPPHVEATVVGTVPTPQYVNVGTRDPVVLTYCPNCAKEHVATKVRTTANGTTVVCIVAGAVIFWPLLFVPMFCDSFKQTNHYCTCCGVKVGRVKALH